MDDQGDFSTEYSILRRESRYYALVRESYDSLYITGACFEVAPDFRLTELDRFPE